MKPSQLDQLLNTCLNTLPKGLQSFQKVIGEHIQMTIINELSQKGLVSRDEFDAQCRVLERLHAKVKELEKQLAEKKA